MFDIIDWFETFLPELFDIRGISISSINIDILVIIRFSLIFLLYSSVLLDFRKISRKPIE